MANTKSAKKHLRQTEKRTAYNTDIKENAKYLVKQAKKAAEANDEKKAADMQAKAIKAIDKAVARNVYKKNTASRLKSRMITSIRQMLSKEAK